MFVVCVLLSHQTGEVVSTHLIPLRHHEDVLRVAGTTVHRSFDGIGAKRVAVGGHVIVFVRVAWVDQ